MRKLHSYATGEEFPKDDEFGGFIVENYRPPLPLNERSLKKSSD